MARSVTLWNVNEMHNAINVISVCALVDSCSTHFHEQIIWQSLATLKKRRKDNGRKAMKSSDVDRHRRAIYQAKRKVVTEKFNLRKAVKLFRKAAAIFPVKRNEGEATRPV